VADDATVADQPPPESSAGNSPEMRHNEGEVAVVTVVTVNSGDHNGEPHLIGNRRLAYDGE
jgi:hypothetical protein